jgi:hypothetical protein
MPAYQHIDDDHERCSNDSASLELQSWKHVVENERRDELETASDTVYRSVLSEPDGEEWPIVTESRHESAAGLGAYLMNNEGWTPFYLRRKTIMFFILIEILILVGLVILYVFDQRNNGLATTDSSMHYFWTYGPTAGQYLHTDSNHTRLIPS